MASTTRTARFGLGAYLALACSLLSILLTGILTVVTEHAASAQVRTSIGTNLANQTANRLDRALFERYREVEALTGRLAGEEDMAQVRRDLDALPGRP